MKIEEIIEIEKLKPYFKELTSFLDQRYAEAIVYPPRDKLFACFQYCDIEDIKVVIIGQDPYHQPMQATGMSFSVPKGIKIPPSLSNIYKELHDDLNIEIPNHGELSQWARQGVLLMNAVMSVEDSNANCHKGKGWELFTDQIMYYLNLCEKPIVFILWGKQAQDKAKIITNPRHLLLKSVHPSPLSSYRGFFGSKPFSKANQFLLANGRKPIDWSISNEI